MGGGLNPPNPPPLATPLTAVGLVASTLSAAHHYLSSETYSPLVVNCYHFNCLF